MKTLSGGPEGEGTRRGESRRMLVGAEAMGGGAARTEAE